MMKYLLLPIYVLMTSPDIPFLKPDYIDTNFMLFKNNYEWLILKDINQLEKIATSSELKPVIIYKHSTRCAISSVTKRRLEKGWDQLKANFDIYYLDIFSYRDISDQIAIDYNVKHESPQILIIYKEKVTFYASHYDITIKNILAHV